jgi:hypothetical protein
VSHLFRVLSCPATTCREEAQVQARHTCLAGDPQVPEEHRPAGPQGTLRTCGEQQQPHKQQPLLRALLQHMTALCWFLQQGACLQEGIVHSKTVYTGTSMPLNCCWAGQWCLPSSSSKHVTLLVRLLPSIMLHTLALFSTLRCCISHCVCALCLLSCRCVRLPTGLHLSHSGGQQKGCLHCRR